MPASEDSSILLPKDKPVSSSGDTEKLSFSDLGKRFTMSLSVHDDEEADCTGIPCSDNNDNTSVIKVDNLQDLAPKCCLSKSSIAPCSGKSTQFDEMTGGEKESDEIGSSSTPLKLVSAMKGSREKQGITPKNLTVTWAPDVYDPPPTSLSHVPSNKGQRHRNSNKKSGKNKQKGSSKSSRGNKGKDKKQSTRRGGSSTSSKSFKPLDFEAPVGTKSFKPLDFEAPVGSSELGASIGFDIGSPELFCGSSFLKKSTTALHFSVAEAT